MSIICKKDYPLKCTAWIAIFKHGIIGPFCFEDDNEQCVIINTDRHVQVLRKFRTALGQRIEVVRVLQWFQQDGATPHTSNESLAWLNHRFSDRLISRKSDPQWSPFSPNYTPPDCYLWGYLKDRVSVHKPQSILDLKRETKTAIRAILREEC